ncbi:MAG: cytochrome oxidase subunit III, partial [Alphaproteobacteria bacterium]
MSARLADGVGIERAHHFETVAQQRYAATLGIWAWLITELLL